MNQPFLSIAVPTFNRVKKLEAQLFAIHKLLTVSQFSRNIELLVVDNCSPDGTQDFIKDHNEAFVRRRDLVVQLLNPKEKKVIFDGCSARGGKMRYINEYTNGKSSINSYDIDHKRLEFPSQYLDKFPSQKNSLDALAKRFDISGYDRSFHGALLDANILADVFVQLTGGQSKFEFMTSNINSSSESELSDCSVDLKKFPIPKIMVSKEDMLANDQRIEAINSKRDSS